MKDDAVDAIWELAERAVREAYLLRSFLIYLAEWDDPPAKKTERIAQWRQEIGIQLGNPSVTDEATVLFQRLRDASPQERRLLVRDALAKSDALYLGQL